MILKGQLLSASNLNNAYISKTDTNSQSIASDLTINGGQLTLTNSVITDSASTSYLRIDPQGNKVIIYDGVNNQELDVYSSSGSEYTRITTINGTPSYSLIDVSSAIDHLEVNTSTKKPTMIGGTVSINDTGANATGTMLNVTPWGNSWNEGISINPSTANNFNAIFFRDVANSTTGSWFLGRLSNGNFGIMNQAMTNQVNTSTNQRLLEVDKTSGQITLGSQLNAYSGVNIKGSNSISFTDYGGGFNMTDATWIRTTGNKSFYHNSGEFRTDGTLEVGNAGATLKVVNGGSAVITAPTTIYNNSLTFDGTATATNQATGIFWTAFDKEGTTDGSDTAHITHTVNSGGLVGSVIEISSQNDNTDGVNFLTNGNNNVRINGNIIWNQGNDGVGSGLDADLIRGQEPFIQRGYLTSANTTDLNTLTNNGVYSLYFANMANTPSGAYQYGQLTVVDDGNNDRTQIYISDTDGSNAGMWFRNDWGRDGTWTTWKKVWTDHNDGSGSGLDADTLDSLDSTKFLRSDQASTIAGNLYINNHGVGGAPAIALAVGDTDTGLHSTTDGTLMVYANNTNVLNVTNSLVTSNRNLSLANNQLQSVSTITGQYGTIAKSTDEWLRLNDDGSHTSGVYFGSSITRTDGEFQVGNAGMYFDVSPSKFTYSGNTIWHAGNQGSNSGLDADKLDGKHANEFMWSTLANGYYGLQTPDGSTANYIRTTNNGIIPYTSGGASTLGTSAWNFNTIYGTTLYENNTSLASKYLGINAKASDSNLLDGLDSSQFLRSDTSSTMTGILTLAGSAGNGLSFDRSRTNTSTIYWNASSTADYGMVFKVDGSTGLTITSSGNSTFTGSVTGTSFNGPLANLGRITASTGRSVPVSSGMYNYGSYNDANTPTSYGEVVGWGRGTNGSAELFVSWSGTPQVYVRSLRDTTDNWTSWNRLLTSSDSNSLMSVVNANGYDGMQGPTSGQSWIRTTQSGIIPYQSGGYSALGTSSWPFSTVYANTFYEGGTAISSKYVSASGDTMSGSYTMTGSFTLNASNAGIEIGSTSASNTPHIDMHSSGYNNDWDVRLIANGGSSGTTGGGTLTIDANIVNLTGSDWQVNSHPVYAAHHHVTWGSGSPSGGGDGDLYIQTS